MAGSRWQEESGAVSTENGDGIDNLQSDKETGLVEKLLSTYGFIRCCDRQARLFFHYSQYKGAVEHLKVGDPVDFEMTFDKKSGKPIAVSVAKICSDVSMKLGVGQKQVNGIVTTELNAEGKGGRVAYENRGECFFFEFSYKDLVLEPGQEKPRTGQKVQFLINQDAGGNIQVCKMRIAPTSTYESASVMSTNNGISTVQTQQQRVAPQQVIPQQFITTPMVYPGINGTTMLAHVPFVPAVQLTHHALNPHHLHHGHQQLVLNGNSSLSAADLQLHRDQQTLSLNLSSAGGGGDGQNGLVGHGLGSIQASALPPNASSNPPSSQNSISIQQQQHFSGQSTNQHQHLHSLHQLEHHPGVLMSAVQKSNGTVTTPNHDPYNAGGGRQGKGKPPPGGGFNNDYKVQQQAQNNNDNTMANSNTNGGNSRRLQYQGVVCALKETFGFVERADIVKEIFFHFSEGYEGISAGDDVCFDITIRKDREVAVNLQPLPQGSVVFEDIDGRIRKGTVTKLPNETDEPLDGRMVFEFEGETREIGFGDRDLSPSVWTMVVGDPVQFQLATDRRDGHERATNITLSVAAQTAFAQEARLTGTVIALKDNYGFVLSEPENVEFYFKQSEVLDSELRVDNVVMFSIGEEQQPQQPQNGRNSPRQVAIRICKPPQASQKKKSGGFRKIKCNLRGYIVALKDHFGFIESETHQEDSFFHYTNFDGDVQDLQVGTEVEYSLLSKSPRPSAECVRSIEKGTIPANELISTEVFSGRVIRSLRCFNPGQVPYCGVVRKQEEQSEKSQTDANANEEQQNENESGKEETTKTPTGTDDEEPDEFEFSVLSLSKPGEVMQKGDLVEFQLATIQSSQKKIAVNVKAIRERRTATVETVKGQMAYLNFDIEGGKKLSFHTNEITKQTTGGNSVSAGDVIEFELTRGRNNKLTATSISRIREKEASPRPAALVNRIKAMAISDDGPRVIALRQPRGPDGSRGFQTLVAAN